VESSIRINKYLAQAGLASRRAADKLIENGEVFVNDVVVKDLGTKINPNKDTIKVKGRIIRPETEQVYLMFHKPKGVLTTMSDPEGRPTVAEYLEDYPVRVYPVGRLDWNTEGLLLFTNDGEFANKIIHPKEEIPKTYVVKVEGKPDPIKIKKLLTGVSIPGGKVRFRSIERLRKADTVHSWYTVVLTQGLNKQIRLMFEKIGHDVLKLHRTMIGTLELGNLRRGQFRILNDVHLRKIFKDPTAEPVKKVRQKSTKRLPPRKS